MIPAEEVPDGWRQCAHPDCDAVFRPTTYAPADFDYCPEHAAQAMQQEHDKGPWPVAAGRQETGGEGPLPTGMAIMTRESRALARNGGKPREKSWPGGW